MNLSGQTVGKYKLIERLGQGGMAQVYRAMQPHIERPVAIKLLHSHLEEDKNFLLRFKREAQRLGQLRHPHIVSVIDFDKVDATTVGQGAHHYMVMDFVAGETLRTVLDRETLLPLDHALLIAEQIAGALTYAHARDIIHRDIKPGNALFLDGEQQHIVLTDFGIAKLMDSASLTATGAATGTPAYISPEAAKGESADARADIYSLGVLLYELVTGETPYKGDSAVALLLQHVTEPLPPLREKFPDVPEQVVQIVERAMQKEPRDRFQSAEAMHEAIQLARLAVLGGRVPHTLVGAANTEFMSIIQQQKPPAAKQSQPVSPAASAGHTWLWAGVAALAIAVLGAGVWFGLGGRAAKTTTPEPVAAIVEPVATVTATLVPPTATATLAPTETPAATPLPTATPTPQPTPEPTATPLPFRETGSFGSVMFSADAVDILLDRVPAPAAETQYRAALLTVDGDMIELGAFTWRDGIAFGTLTVEQNVLPLLSEVVVFAAREDETFSADMPIVYRASADAAYSAAFTQLFSDSDSTTSHLTGIQSQYAIAFDHYNFALGALASGDVNAIKLHTEHIINVLDGEQGGFFGDLNFDGQAQNPGDSLGLRGYLAESLAQVMQAVASEPETQQRNQRVAAVVAQLDAASVATDAILKEASRLLAIDTLDEATPILDNVAPLFDQLLNGPSADEGGSSTADSGESAPASAAGGLLTVADAVFALATLSLHADTAQPAVASPEPIANAAGRVALLRMLPATNEFVLLVDQPTGSYHLWGRAAGGDAVYLSAVTERVVFGTFDAPLDTLILAHGSAEALDETAIVAQGQTTSLSAQLLDVEQGVLSMARQQALVALEHVGFMQGSLDAGDLNAAKNHAEHVVNILDGDTGAIFGDLNFDGQAQNPGDGTGVRVYLDNGVETLLAQPTIRSNVASSAELAAQLTQRAADQLQTVFAVSLKLFAADSADEARPFGADLRTQMDALLNGVDNDANGVVDVFAGEGGLQQLLETVALLDEVELVSPDAESAEAATSLTRTNLAKQPSPKSMVPTQNDFIVVNNFICTIDSE